MNQRATLRNQWLESQVNPIEVIALPADASFRNYFRIVTQDKTYLLMDAPPALENIESFIAIAKAYRQQDLCTPIIFAQNLNDGFLLLEDFGDTLLSKALNVDSVDRLYRLCYHELPKIQACQTIDQWQLMNFIEQLLPQELLNFKEWCVLKFCQLTLSHNEEYLLNNTFSLIATICAQQPQVGVHRDYQSRNLMLLPHDKIGVIDFQDAVIGPITYDLVSLLRDCYVNWPEEQVATWVDDYYHTFAAKKEYTLTQFHRWFDWQGLQRHLKNIFIFCRKYLRDHNINYLKDILRALHYIEIISDKYPELHTFHQFMINRLSPIATKKINEIH